MAECPGVVDGARVLLFTPIDHRHRFTGRCRHTVAGELVGPVAGLAVCQYDGEEAFYLFGCDENWKARTDTWHQSLEDAMRQAEFEYEGTSATWTKPQAASQGETSPTFSLTPI